MRLGVAKRSRGYSTTLLTALLAIGASSLLACGDPCDGKCCGQCKSCDKDSDCCGNLICRTNGWDSDKHCEPEEYQDEQLCTSGGDGDPCEYPGLRCFNAVSIRSCHCSGWIVVTD